MIGILLAVLASTGGILLGAWTNPDTFAGIVQWLERAMIQAAYVALIAVFLWSLRGRRNISFLLIFGVLLTGVFAWHGTATWQANRLRVVANTTLSALRDGRRPVDDLSAAEQENPYVDAYVTMRDVFWELHNRADTRMAHYRALYAEHTRAGGFLDPKRLGTTYDLWYSIAQIYDLEHRLEQIADIRVEYADLMWTINLLSVDEATRKAYADDLRAAIAAVGEAQSASIDRERKTLAQIKRSLEVLVAAQGHYRISGGQIVFERPDDALAFAGKGPPGQ